MTVAETSARGNSANEFPTTHWTDLQALNDPGHPEYTVHLGALIHKYWKPAYHYLRALRRSSADDARDLTQQFFTMLLSRRDLEKLSPDLGSFRGFLKTALRNFVNSARRAEISRREGMGGKTFRFSEAEEEWLQVSHQSAALTPDDAFDRKWIRDVIFNAVAELREELAVDEKSLYYEIFRDYCLDDAATPPTYDELAARYGVGPDDVRNYLRYARQRMRKIVKRTLVEYVGPRANIEDELAFILSK